MRRVTFLFLVMTLCPALLWAGPIYGAVFFNGGALRGASISIACAGSPPATGSTLDDGSYRIPVPGQGRCTFTVTSPSFQGPASAEVISSPNAEKYNFVVVQGGGGYELRRQ